MTRYREFEIRKDERLLMQTHTIVGEQMLGGVALLQGTGVHVVRSHHERWDGDGYPDRLVGGEIPLGARIFAVADTLDAITSDRPYRAALPWSTAHEVIVDETGRQFDERITPADGRGATGALAAQEQVTDERDILPCAHRRLAVRAVRVGGGEIECRPGGLRRLFQQFAALAAPARLQHQRQPVGDHIEEAAHAQSEQQQTDGQQPADLEQAVGHHAGVAAGKVR